MIDKSEKREQAYIINKSDLEAVAWAVNALRAPEGTVMDQDRTEELAELVNRCVGLRAL